MAIVFKQRERPDDVNNMALVVAEHFMQHFMQQVLDFPVYFEFL
jgi:hypothetical protein